MNNQQVIFESINVPRSIERIPAEAEGFCAQVDGIIRSLDRWQAAVL